MFANHFLQLGQYLMGYLFLLWLCILVFNQVGQCFIVFSILYQYSCLPSTWIHIQTTFSSQFLHGCCASGSISASSIENILLLFCLLWPHYLLWPIHVWWANISAYLMPHHLVNVANHVWYTPWGLVGVHLRLLFLVCPV